ncbi:MAG: hypothetical protein K2J99_04125 [Lachnospiraceae bacterium]|nr:hypothetical protein [Lachnospiraceae bacterium]
MYKATIGNLLYPLGWESTYIFVDMGTDYPIMLITGITFDYETEQGEKIQTCMDCEVYYHDNGQTILLGTLGSLSTGYPIAYDETGFYEAGAHGVRKWILDESGSSPCLKAEQETYLSDVRNTSADEYNRLYHDYLSAQIIDYGDSEPFQRKLHDEEVELLQLLEAESGCRIMEYDYLDMDHDGKTEIIGSYKQDDLWHILYLCSDDKICRELESFRYDHCKLLPYPIYDDTTYLGIHLIVNVYDDAGIDKRFSIYALGDHELQPVISNQFGHAYIDDTSVINQTLNLNVEDYGDGYSAITCLCFDGSVYKEYGLSELSEGQFMQYGNAEKVLADIRAEIDSSSIEFSYFLRADNHVLIQCESISESGDTQFCHFTLRASGDNQLEEAYIYQRSLHPATGQQTSHTASLYNRHEGRVKEFYTDLDVIYPDL